MKTFRLLLSVTLVALAFTACKEKNGLEGDGGGLTKVTWKVLTEKYPFLNHFPAYTHDIDIHNHNDMMGMESVSFFDRDCPKSYLDEYCGQIEKTDFVKESDFSDLPGGTVTYEKEADGVEYTLQLSHAAGHLSTLYTMVKPD